MLATPILFLVFNRPNTTEKVFQRIREVQPQQLYIVADGPRIDKPGEKEKCDEVRHIVNQIDWPCEVHKLFRENNLGCGLNVSEGITWFFSKVEKGIILEDDCLPDSTFFSFAETALKFYENDDNIMHVSGANLQCGIRRSKYSYYFSKFPLIWGWATWKKAWEKYQYIISDTDDEIKKNLYKNLTDTHADFFYPVIKKVKLGEIDTWDYQWLYAMVKSQGLGLVPEVNLVKNIGFDKSATHTTEVPIWYKFLKIGSMNKVIYEPLVQDNVEADDFYVLLSMGKIKRSSILYQKLIYYLNLCR
ncbi:nucleotide-diphospho-sugar transferase [Hymenobacter sp. HD11105]